MELGTICQGAAGVTTTETRLTFADKHPEVGLVGRVRLYAAPQICAETLSVQFSLSGKQNKRSTTQSSTTIASHHQLLKEVCGY